MSLFGALFETVMAPVKVAARVATTVATTPVNLVKGDSDAIERNVRKTLTSPAQALEDIIDELEYYDD